VVETKAFKARQGSVGGTPALPNPHSKISLGDWNDTWDFFARNAVAGEWEKNGANSVKRLRSSLTPETPVRNIEGLKIPQG
jgi:hypothetical protein